MTAVRSVAVIGGGVAGFAVAVLLAEADVAVDLVEAKPDVAALGSGITLQGNALRVLRTLGLWEQARRAGHCFDSIGLRLPSGELVAEVTDARTGGPDLPAAAGMYRPDLARLLATRATEAGVKVRTGTVPVSLVQDDDGVDLRFSDGSSGRYDLVVGADGVRSWTREAVGVELETHATGMGIWRAFTARPASVTRTELCYGGAAHIAGYCPTGEDSVYAYLVEDAQDRSALSAAGRLAAMRSLAEGYHGPWDEIRAQLVDAARVHYTWFETHLLDGPWHRGRVVLIGDAVHCCPPTLAQGAAMALEDAAVLAELLLAADGLDEGLWASFTSRRLERVRTVVDSSLHIGRMVAAGEQSGVPELMGRVSALVSEPA